MINKFEHKEMNRCSIEEIDWYVMWKKNNTVAEELVSSESESITLLLLFITSHKVALLSYDIVADDGWNIPSTFPQQTVKQLEVIQEMFLSEESKLDDFTLGVMDKK